MRRLTAGEMLSVWEEGRGRTPSWRGLLLLASACPEASWEALAALPVGERDDRLLTLRELTFGPDMASVAVCPACGERLDVAFTVADVRVPAGAARELEVSAHGYDVSFRLPDSTDLMALEDDGEDPRHLLRRCVLSARSRGRRRSFSRLPARVLDAVAERMGQADPRARIETSLVCPDCGHAWQAVFDIVSFFWDEVEAWVRRTLEDVHVLASAYGWREADILELSPWRRDYYLQRVLP